MHIDDELQKHAASSRRDSHYSSQRTVLSYSTSHSRRRSSSIDIGNYSYYNNPSARNSRPDSIRQLDSENFTLTDEYSFIDGNDSRRTRARSNGNINYLYNNNNNNHDTTRPGTSGRMTSGALVEDEKIISNFSRKGSLASVASKRSGKNHGHKCKNNNNNNNAYIDDSSNGSHIVRHNKSDNKTMIPDLPGTNHSIYEKAAGNRDGDGTWIGSNGNEVEALMRQWPGVSDNGAKATDLSHDHAGQDLRQGWPSDLILDGTMISTHNATPSDQGRKSQTRVLAGGISPAIQLNDWSQISSNAPTSGSRKECSDDYVGEKFHADVAVYSTRGNMSSQKSLVRWRLADKFSALGYLIMFSMLGTLARIGLGRLTFYPGAPVSSSVLWANLTGCFLIGILAHEKQLLDHKLPSAQYQHTVIGSQRYDDGNGEKRSDGAGTAANASNSFYIGLTVGFCGSFTSFSGLMHDAFLAISADLPGLGSGREVFDEYDDIRTVLSSTPSRSPFYSILSVLAILIVNAALSISAFVVGKHLAGGLTSFLPVLPRMLLGSNTTTNVGGKNVLNIVIFFISIILWSATITLAALSKILDISSVARTTFLFPLAFAPAGCLLRYALSMLNQPHQQRNQLLQSHYQSLDNRNTDPYGNAAFLHPHLNIHRRTLWQRISSSPYIFVIPLGTLIANLIGTLIFSLAWDFRHGLSFSSISASDPLSPPELSSLSCHVLAGLQDGFCGALTTVSTLVMEITSIAGVLRLRRQHAKRKRGKMHHVQQEERWWVAQRQQRQKQRRERELAREREYAHAQQRTRTRTRCRSLESSSTPTERGRGPSRLELRERMKPQARFIASARSNYHENENENKRFRGHGGTDDPYDNDGGKQDTRGGRDGYRDGNDGNDGNDDVDGYYDYDYDYRRAYAYGIGTGITGLLVAVVVMGSVRWWMGGWDEGVEGGRFCSA